MTMNLEPLLQIRVRCTELPGHAFTEAQNPVGPRKEPIYLGIQRGDEVVEMVSADKSEATFIAEFRIGTKADGAPNFLGPYAQGTPQDRFFYLSWLVEKSPGHLQTFRRLKIRLGHLGWQEIRKSVKTESPLEVTLRLTDAKGGPLCATPPSTHIRWGAA